jgi:hypothetical protein
VDICTLKHSLEVLSPILALVAAAFWFASAWAGWFPFVSTPWGAIERYMKWQAVFSGIAAACAGLAALIQFATTTQHVFPVCRAFS